MFDLWLFHAALAFAIALMHCLLHHYHYAACHVIYDFKDALKTSKYLLQGFFVYIQISCSMFRVI